MINVKSSDIKDLFQQDPTNTNIFTTMDKDIFHQIYTFSASLNIKKCILECCLHERAPC
jgi:uncharacterized pyridoxamine 5'-phosphate oxidase family protein